MGWAAFREAIRRKWPKHPKLEEIPEIPTPELELPPAPGLTVCIAGFGDDRWRQLAISRAIPSAQALDVAVIHVHLVDGTLAEARNAALAEVNTEFVVFLDCDDELEPGFAEAMLKGDSNVRVPIVRLVRPGQEPRLWMPKVWGHEHECTRDCLPYGNFAVIGSVAETALLREIGGFDEYPIYEDWHCWGKLYNAGATFEAIPDAVYRQHLSLTSRNHSGQAFENHDYWHRRIGHDLWPDMYADPGSLP